MNAEAPLRGLTGILKSLNCDRAYGWALLAVIVLLAGLELGGDAWRDALSYDRAALASGQWWRLISAHFVHLDAQHMLLNSLGVVLMWALFARDYSPLRWLAIYLFSSLTISAGLWVLNPEVPWYVGSSSALHGVMAAGTLAICGAATSTAGSWRSSWSRNSPTSSSRAPCLLPATHTIVDAHFYGAIGGLALAFLLRSRREPQ